MTTEKHYLTPPEVMQALLDGKRVRWASWHKGSYVWLRDGDLWLRNGATGTKGRTSWFVFDLLERWELAPARDMGEDPRPGDLCRAIGYIRRVVAVTSHEVFFERSNAPGGVFSREDWRRGFVDGVSTVEAFAEDDDTESEGVSHG